MVYPRSAIKAIQALPLIETGTADALAVDDAELASMFGGHSGGYNTGCLGVEFLLEFVGPTESA